MQLRPPRLKARIISSAQPTKSFVSRKGQNPRSGTRAMESMPFSPDSGSPKFPEIGPSKGDSGPNLSSLAHIRPRPVRPGVGRARADSDHLWADFNQFRDAIGQFWREVVQLIQNGTGHAAFGARVRRPKLTNFDKVSPRTRPSLARSRTTRPDFGDFVATR